MFLVPWVRHRLYERRTCYWWSVHSFSVVVVAGMTVIKTEWFPGTFYDRLTIACSTGVIIKYSDKQFSKSVTNWLLAGVTCQRIHWCCLTSSDLHVAGGAVRLTLDWVRCVSWRRELCVCVVRTSCHQRHSDAHARTCLIFYMLTLLGVITTVSTHLPTCILFITMCFFGRGRGWKEVSVFPV